MIRIKGYDNWKIDPTSNDYDCELIQSRVEQFRVAREQNDLETISFLLRASMSRGFGDIGNMGLYSQSYIGTKKLIEDFNEEMILALEYMYRELLEDNSLARRNKYEFFRGLRHMLGNTALLLSGGAALGTHHIGVLKALFLSGLLPRIISGSSSGSIMAAMLCTRTDAEMPGLLNMESVNMNFLDEPTVGHGWQQYLVKFRRLLKEGVVFDQNVLQTCMTENLGHITFLEAFKKTRRILNIAVSSETQHELPRMLNYLTAPNVLIWSAVVASCAVPGVFLSSGLMAKDPRTGAFIPWNSGEDSKWIDGSVENDIPRARLGELFNVNHFIVSQVNPHVYPFLERKRHEPGTLKSANKFLRTILYLIHSEACFRLKQLISLKIVFPRQLHRLLCILTQKYDGDITIVPDLTPSDLKLLFADPNMEQIFSSIRRGEKATWPLISIVWNQCKVEILLDQILSKLKRKNLKGSLKLRTLKVLRESSENLSALNNSNSNSSSSNSKINSPKGHFRRSSSPLVYRTFETSLSIDGLNDSE